MTCGIYAIQFEESDLFYVGQSTNIEVRWKSHLNDLRKNKHYNYKMQFAFNNCRSDPKLVVLEECSTEELDDKEIYYITNMNTIDEGLNINSGGSAGRGLQHGSSKYSKEILVTMLKMLASDEVLPILVIAKELGIPRNYVVQLKDLKLHKWMWEELPELCNKVLEINQIRLTEAHTLKGEGVEIVNMDLIGPDGTIYLGKDIVNQSKFARDHGLHASGVNSMLKGRILNHKGFKVLVNKGCQLPVH